MTGTLGSLDSLAGVPLHLAMDKTGVGLVACDQAGRMTLISPVLQDLFEMVYEPDTEPYFVAEIPLFKPDGETPLPAEDVPLTRARGGEFVKDQVISTRRADGSLVHLKCNASPLLDDCGRDNGAIALVQDVTAEVDAQLRAEAMRMRLMETINHEFRTPLAALLGHVELVQDHLRSDGLDPDLATWLAAIERSGWRLRDLLEEISGIVACEGD